MLDPNNMLIIEYLSLKTLISWNRQLPVMGGRYDNNDWVEEDPEEEEEDEEEDPEENPEEAENEEMEVDEEENHSEVSEPDEPPTPVYQSTYHVGESSTTRTLLDGNSEDLSEQVEELRLECRRGRCLSQWEAQVRPQIPEGLRFREEPPVPPVSVPRADDPYVMVREAALAAEDDDADTAEDPQPSEFRGSSRDP
ncbi:hypothetical protein Tco_0007999 [Tanacetum coccineum]